MAALLVSMKCSAHQHKFRFAFARLHIFLAALRVAIANCFGDQQREFIIARPRSNQAPYEVHGAVIDKADHFEKKIHSEEEGKNDDV